MVKTEITIGGFSAKLIAVVIGALGTMTKRLVSFLIEPDITTNRLYWEQQVA